MINTPQEADYLIQKLNYFTTLYDLGRPMITDKQWDDMYFELDDYERRTGDIHPDSPTQKVFFEVLNKLDKVKHNHPMLSLAKTKDKAEIEKFIGKEDWVAMLKMDGLTCSLEYKAGVLIRAETRGNGEIGEDITHNAKFIKGIPHHLENKEDLIVDGEIICTYADFNKFDDEYKNPRNFASGSARLLDSEECKHRNLTFVAWDIISNPPKVYMRMTNKLDALKVFGFKVVPYMYGAASELNIEITIDAMQNMARLYTYPIDGIVFKYDSCVTYEAAGQTSHHFNGGLAYKFYDDLYPTRLKYIDWTMGRAGQLTPVAVFDPVEIDGAIVERASLHNVSIMRDILGPCAYVGEPLEIYKANQIIPQIDNAGPWCNYGEVIAAGGVSANDAPERCPYCGADVSYKHEGIADILYCDNPNCEGKLVNILEHFCSKKAMDIKGLSKKTLEKLVDWGWIENIVDIYKLKDHRSEWIKKPGFGAASVDKILNSIENSRQVELWRVIASAGIPEIGTSASKALANTYKTWHSFRMAIQNEEDFSKLPDFGEVMSNNISKFNYNLIDQVVNEYISTAAAAKTDLEVPESVPAILTGKQFCITGKLKSYPNRDALKDYIESLGGKVTGSVTSKTDYLISNDFSATEKHKTAERLGKPIITEKDFDALISELLAN